MQNGELRVNNLAWWDGDSWSADGLAGGNGNQSEFGNIDPVLSVAIRDDTLFVGHLGNQWHDATELAYATMLVNGEWRPCAQANGTLWFLETNGRMFSGGVHDSLYNEYAPGIYEWRAGSYGTITNMPFDSEIGVYDVAYWQGQYYFGGIFSAFGCTRMVAFDGVDQWSGLGEGVGGNFIETVCGFGDSLYVGGFFEDGPNVQSQHIQIWDGAVWKPFFNQVQFDGAIRDIQVHNGTLYVSGYHTWANDLTAYGLLRYDGHQLCSIGGPVGGDVGKMAFFHGDLYHSNHYIPGLEQEWIGRLPLEGLIPDRCVEVGPNAVPDRSSGTYIMTVGPNPASGELHMQLPTGTYTNAIVILDAIGREVRTVMIPTSDRSTLAVHDLPPGTYTVQCTAHGARYFGRFVKQE